LNERLPFRLFGRSFGFFGKTAGVRGSVAGFISRGAETTDLGDRGIVCDWREPDVIRIAPVPLYNRFIDVFELVEELANALREIA